MNVPLELKSRKTMKRVHMINVIFTFILLTILTFFIFIYLEYYWSINFGIIRYLSEVF